MNINKYMSVWRGVNVGKAMDYYKNTKTKRTFHFYGVQIGWWMIGITISRQVQS